MSLADIRARARSDLHHHMRRPASLYDKSGVLVGLVHVRTATDIKAVGDLAGTNLSYAEVQEPVSKLIFWLEEHQPERGQMVVLSANEGYYLDTLDPIDGQTQTVQVSRMSTSELAGKTLPGDL